LFAEKKILGDLLDNNIWGEENEFIK
jgi:hypothetical protein